MRKAKPRRKPYTPRIDVQQTRLNLKPGLPNSDLDREVREFVQETRRDPLPGQNEIPWGKS